MLRSCRVHRLLVRRPYVHAAAAAVARSTRARRGYAPSSSSSATQCMRLSRALDTRDAHVLLASVVRARARASCHHADKDAGNGDDSFCRGAHRRLHYNSSDSSSSDSSSGEDALAHAVVSAPCAHADATVRVLCACVAVCVPASHWPPWLRATLQPRSSSSNNNNSCTALQAMLATVHCVQNGTGAASAASCAAASCAQPQTRATATAASSSSSSSQQPPPLHAIALSTLTAITDRLCHDTHSEDSTDAVAAATARLLRRVALLCRICIAPSPAMAVELAVRAVQRHHCCCCCTCTSSCVRAADDDNSGNGNDDTTAMTHLYTSCCTMAAIGQALRAYGSIFVCSTTTRTTVLTLEAWWLRTWRHVCHAAAAAAAAHTATPAVASHTASSPSLCCHDGDDGRDALQRLAGVDATALLRQHLVWSVHALLAHAQYDAVVRTIQRAADAARTAAAASNDSKQAATAVTTMVDAARLLQQLLPATTRAALLACMPLRVLYAHALHDALAHSLLPPLSSSAHANDDAADITTATPAPPRGSLPYSSSSTSSLLMLTASDAVLYARVLDSALTQCVRCTTHSACTAALRVLHALLTSGNADTLLASLVPPSRPLADVMVAQHSSHRAARARTLVSALQRCLSTLCHDGSSSSSDSSTNGEDSDHIDDKENDVVIDDNEVAAAHTAVAVWRRSVVLSCTTTTRVAEAVVTACTRVCVAVLTRSARRAESLPTRVAMPAWRRAVCARTALRAHKYELLLSELPHVCVRDALTVLLRGGYLHEACCVGACLLQHNLIDLTHYALPLLGSLYQAMTWHALCTHDRADDDDNDNDNDNNDDNNDNCSGDAVDATVVSCARDAARRGQLRQLRQLYARRRDVFGDNDDTSALCIHTASTAVLTADGCGSSGEDRSVVATAATAVAAADGDEDDGTTPQQLPPSLRVRTTLLAGVCNGKIVSHATVLHYIRCLLSATPLCPGSAMALCSGRTSSSSSTAVTADSTSSVFAPWRRSGSVRLSV